MNVAIDFEPAMKRKIIYLMASLIFCMIFSVDAQRKLNEDYLNYIDKYKDIAISEMERAGVPASIKLAQGLLESGGGRSTLAREAKNHFGMKCGNAWKGKTYYREDDDYDKEGTLLKSCFRVFKDPESSFVAHSEFLRDPKKNQRYGFLFLLDPKDYRLWARGLKESGYATNPKYANLLISLIENYELFIYDYMDTGTGDTGVATSEGGIIFNDNKVNGARIVLAKAGETVEDASIRGFTSLKNILKFNEELTSSDQVLEEDYRIFLQPKRNNFRGKKKYHYVKGDDSMFSLSQLYGVKIDKLYKKNRLNIGTEPAVGERIKLRGWRISSSEAPRPKRKGEKVKQLKRIPNENKNKGQDPEIEFDTENPATSIEDFEVPGRDGSLIPDDLTDPNRPGNNQPGTGVNTTTGTTNPPTTTNTNPNPTNSGGGMSSSYHVVRDGDTLYRLSKKYGITVRDLKKLNGLETNTISLGQRLRIR